eukprot:394458_1
MKLFKWLHLMISLSLAVKFTPITNVINITDYGSFSSYNGFTCSINDYIDPLTNEKYNFITIQNTYEHTRIESDIFNSKNLQKYNNTNNMDIINELPFTVVSNKDPDQSISYPDSCKNRVTDDIIVCYNIFMLNNPSFIECKIYFDKLQKWTSAISVSGPNEEQYNNYLTPNGGHNILCFNDSYLVIYTCSNGIGGYHVFRYSLIDLNGDLLIQNETYMNIGAGIYPYITKSNFEMKLNNEYISNTFLIEYETCNYVSNTCDMLSSFGYYTNINDQNPIHHFKDNIKTNLNVINCYSGNDQGIGSNISHPFNSLFIHITNNCCYVSPYLYGRRNSVGSITGSIWMSVYEYDGTQIFNHDINVSLSDIGSDWIGSISQSNALSMINNNYFVMLYTLNGDIYGSVYHLKKHIIGNTITVEFDNKIKLINNAQHSPFQSHVIDENILISWTTYEYNVGTTIKGRVWTVTNN